MILISITISGATKGNGNENQTEIKEKTAAAEQLISYAGIEEYRVQSFDTLSSIADVVSFPKASFRVSLLSLELPLPQDIDIKTIIKYANFFIILDILN